MSCFRASACLLILAACAPATETIVVLEMAPESQKRAVTLRVRVCNEEGELVLNQSIKVADAPFPARVPLLPRADDSARTFAVLAELLDEGNAVFSRQRVIGGYRDREQLERRRLFSDPCFGLLTCGRDETCDNGGCIDARVPPVSPRLFPCDPPTACEPGKCDQPSPYVPNTFAWKRSNDWALASGSNPGNDLANNPAWQYEVTSGGTGLGAYQPWYTLPSRLMTWDMAVGPAMSPAWVRDADLAPAVTMSTIEHALSSARRGLTPIVRWLNPTGRDVTVDITGSLTFTADSPTGTADVVVLKGGGASRTFDPLVEIRSHVVGSAPIKVEKPMQRFRAQDSLVISVRGKGDSGTIKMNDDLTIRLTEIRPR